MAIDFVPDPPVSSDCVFDAVVTYDEATKSWTAEVPDIACAAIRGATRREAEADVREALAAILGLTDGHGLRVVFHYAPRYE